MSNNTAGAVAAAIAHIEGVSLSMGSLAPNDDHAMGVEINIEDLGGDPEDALEAAHDAINSALAPLGLALGEGAILDGLEFIPVVPRGDNTLYLIRVTRHYYAGTIHNGRVQYYGQHLAEHGMDPHATIVGFPSRAAAKAAIEAIEDGTYLLGNGEYARPTLRAVPVSAAPDHVRRRVVAQEAQDAN